MSTIDSIPVARDGLPFIGHGLSLLKDPLALLTALPEQGALCRIRVGARSVVVVCDPALTWTVLVDDRTFDKGGPFYERSREIAGDGLGTCPHSRHRRQRRLCQPAFRPDRLRSYAGIMSRSIENMVNRWHDGQVLDLGSEVSAVTFGVAARTMFSASLSDRLIRQVATDLGSIAAGLFRRTVLPPWVNRLPTPGSRRYRTTTRRVRRIAASVIAERRADDRDTGDLLSALLRARDPDETESGAAFTDEELVDQVFTFFLAGAESSAGCVTWALYLLDRHPEVRRRVHAEVDSALTGRTPVLADLPALPMINRVVRETLRLYPPAWLVTRQVSADTELGGVRLPAGTMIAVSPYIIHRRADVYDNPHDFVPDRWDDTAAHRRPYLPFGGGARKCIGEQFGLVEVALALATITARWRLSPTGRPITMSLTQLPTPRGLQMRVNRRRVSQLTD
ncbi:cytochrome P450 [Nocardia terpenica]|uniref:Cytochrome P450 n=1 Tax=Nocardia terpenica TaxID=455432 RepID=A0A6G9ZCW9_9NOCA|nr:cytochrome P450 [Nocardia terpenica]QIS23388.1 cytochrome P450 [Nocardia terpenica]